jgi:hypothetical protein
MKKIKLLFAAFAAMVGLGAQAQSWTASAVAQGEFYLLNVGTGEYFTKGNGYGTQASITTNGSASSALKVKLEDLDLIYKIRTDVNGDGNGVEYLSGGTIYTDQSRGKNSAWRFDQVGSNANGPIYTICSAGPHGGGEGKYMTASAENTIVGPADNGNSVYAQWQIVAESQTAAIYAEYVVNAVRKDYQAVRTTIVAWTTSDAISNADEAKATFSTALEATDAKVDAATSAAEVNEAIAELKAAGNTFLESVTIGGGLDITNAWITNPAPGINGHTDGWTNSGSPTLSDQLFEYWNVSGGSTKQTLVNLPKGAYKLTAIAYTRDNMTATLYAGDNTVNVVGCGSVNTRGEGNTWIAANETNGRTNLSFTLKEAAASLEIGLIADNATGDHWMCWRSFSLTYYGDPINLKKAELAAAVTTAETIKEGTIPTAAYSAFAAVVTANNKAWSTEDEYDAAVAAINDAVAIAQPLVAPYAAYKIAAENAAIAGVASETINAQNVAVEEATTAEAIEACTAVLNAAIAPIAGFDITSFTITNASPYANGNGWTATNGNRLSQWASNPVTYDNDNKCAEMWNNTGASMLYTITNLPAGNYRLTAIAGTRTNSGSVLKVGDKTIDLVSVGSLNSRAEVGGWFDGGNGVNELFFSLDNAAAELTIGLVAGTSGDAWTLWRSFKLETFDESVAAGYLAPGYATLVESAQATLADEAYKNVTGDEKTALEAAVAATPTTIAEYEAATEALNTALNAFKAAKTNYDIFATERALADAISTDIEVAAPTTAENALTQFRALKVAEYNYVATEYPYSATSKIGDFNGWTRSGSVNGNTNVTFEALTSQHWSGTAMTYYEQPAGGWSTSANTTWTANYQKVTTLPAGSYVIKVAARAASGSNTVAKITCSAATVEGPIFNFGDTGKGITTAGAASFDEGEFANGGNGRGWVWNYLPFTLDAETEVTMTVVAEAKGDRQWFSVCDGELLSMTNIATAVAYDEATTNTIKDVDVANVTMTRNIKEGFNTVVLPFDLTANQVQTAFGSGTEVYAFSENGEENAENITISFNKVVAGTISANVPVLVKATEASTEQVFEGVQVVAPTESAIVTGKNANFVGVFGPTTIGTGHFFIGNGALYKSAGATTIKAFRAYIQLAHPNVPNAVRMFVDGEETETGIENVNVSDNDNQAVIYNVAGQRISKMQKGINIVNGKKVLK